MTPTQILILLLARTCIAEIGFQGTNQECVLMWQINQRRAEEKNWTLKQQTLNYNQYWTTPSHRKARPWIANLEGKNKPPGWPRNLKWKRHVKKWLEIKKAAKQFVAGHCKKICLKAIDYGAPYDIPPAGRARIRCLGGKTMQRYYREI